MMKTASYIIYIDINIQNKFLRTRIWLVNVIKHFDIEGIKYVPTPNFTFYKNYRDLINEMRSHITSFVIDSNAAFSGFLMISMGEFSVNPNES